MKHLNNSLLRAAGFLAAFATTLSASVSIGSKDNIQIGGFFSQGWIKSSGNNYPVEALDGTGDFREMAININTTVGSHLRLGAQGFAQSIGNYGNDKVLLDWAVVDYNFRPEFGLRAGRVKFPKGLYGEALDLDMVRPFVFLPMGIYNPVTRDFNASFNGAMVYGSIGAGRAGTFDYKVFFGDIPMNSDQGVADFFTTTGIYAAPGVQELGMDYTTGAQVFWNTPLSGLRIGVSYSYLSKVFGNGKFAYFPAADIKVVGDKYSYKTVSVEYIRNNWTFAAEWESVGDTFNVTSLGPVQKEVSGSEVWYVSAAYRLNSRFELGTYFSRIENANAAANTPSAQRKLDDIAISARFDLNENVLFKVEYHEIDGRMGLFNTPRTPNPIKKDSSSFFAAKTTFSF
ncbi:MAG: hypothetical protein QG602_2645 [Verrucomicrobiota bacterium]|nr:hypothetical protein [Verrucomicrobiota bacterium]